MDFDLIVIGGGAFGLSTAAEAARRKLRTLLIEQHTIPNPLAASYGASRKIRSVYSEAHYVRLAREALTRWHEIEAELGVKLFHEVGSLYYTNLAAQPELEVRIEAAATVGTPIRVLDRPQLRAEFPHFKRAQRGLFEPDTGYLKATVCIEALYALAQKAGAAFELGQPVEVIEPTSGGLAVRVDGRMIGAPRVVVAGGGWTSQLFPELRAALRQYQQGLLYLHDVPTVYNSPTMAPYACLDTMHYGVGAEPGVGLKVAQHHLGEPLTSPDFDRASVPPGFLESTTQFVRDDLELEPRDFRLSWESCMYNVSPRSDLLLDFHPDWPGLFFATAGSGHGFKYGSNLGAVVIDRLEGIGSDRWNEHFSWKAFHSAEPVTQLR